MEALHAARGDDGVGGVHLEVEHDAGAAPVPAGRDVVGEHVAADEDGRLQLDALGRDVPERAGREVDAVDAVPGRPAAAAALHGLQHVDPVLARLGIEVGEQHDRDLAGAGRRDLPGDGLGERAEHGV